MELWIIKKCIKMLLETVWYTVTHGLFPGLVTAVIIYLALHIFIKKKDIEIRQVPLFINLIYMCSVLWVTTFSRQAGQYDMRVSFELYFLQSDWYSILQTLQNLSLTLPVGIYFMYLSRKFKATVVIGMVYSLFIECIQLLTGRGTFEISDLIMNTVGAFVGGILYFFGSKLFQAIVRCGFKKRNEK